MKKRIAALLAVLSLVLSMLSGSVLAANAAKMLGDVDGNESVDYFDAMTVMQYFAGLITEAELDTTAADVDDNGGIDFFDAMYILQYFAGIIEKLPGEPEPTEPTEPDFTGSDDLTVHFIDVGQADCALLETGGQYMLIDGGNREDGQLVISYLEQQGVEELDYVVCTHAHEDHVGGLPSVLAVYPTAAVYSPTKTYASNVYDDFLYYVDQQGLEVTIPEPGDAFTLGESKITVLGPVESYAEPNNTSIVLLVEFGDTRFLFTGDMETAAENDLLDYWEGEDLNVDVLKVGHHGSSTSSGYRFIYETDPEYAVISCGENNSYGHPNEEVVSRFQDAEIPMFRTDQLGHIIAVSDGTEITVTWEDQTAQPDDVEPGEPTAAYFIGNKNSKKLHIPDCKNLPMKKNQVIFDSYSEAIAAGYDSCANCLG